jgi:hypothetical protein
MKNPLRSLQIFSAIVVLLIAGNAGAQTVSIGAIPASHFCVGDPISVRFTATGNWDHRNAFTLQLSDATGSFSSGFKNLVSFVDSLPGTFTVSTSIPYVSVSSHYRFRILAAIPYVTSADNGIDITIGTGPGGFGMYLVPTGGAIGNSITFAATGFNPSQPDDAQDSAIWNFGAGASPETVTTTGLTFHGVGFSQDVTYSTTGDKSVTLRIVKPGGCFGYTLLSAVHIYDCSLPSIPNDAIVVNSDTVLAQANKAYWINPGFTFGPGGGDTVFVEAGATITGLGGGCLLYMKAGSVLNSPNHAGAHKVIYATGASINAESGDFTLNCPTLDFDYTNAPPNSAHPLAVNDELKSASITLSPNPTSGVLQVQGLTSEKITASVYNVLGEMVVMQKDLRASDHSLDLSKLLPGAYYVRLSSAGSVVTKKIVRN